MSDDDLTTAELMPFWIRVHGLGCSPGYLLLSDPQSEDGLFCGKGVFFTRYSWTLAKTVTSKMCWPQTLWQFLLCFPLCWKCVKAPPLHFQITKCGCFLVWLEPAWALPKLWEGVSVLCGAFLTATALLWCDGSNFLLEIQQSSSLTYSIRKGLKWADSSSMICCYTGTP